MRRTILLFLVLLLLSGCSSGRRQISGLVIEWQTDAAGVLTSLVVETEDGEERGILLTEETAVFSQVEGISREAFLSGEFREISVSADYDQLDQTLTTSDGREIKACPADFLTLEQAHTGDVTLEDGTAVELWQGSFSDRYRLEDGTELLSVSVPSGPDGVFVGGLESFDNLSAAAQERVSAYFREQGLLYDTAAELERAYQAYQADSADFDSFLLEQSISPTASNDHVMYFLTTVALPIDGNTMTELQLGSAFDRETGEVLDVWSLFTGTPEETAATLLDAAQIADPTLRREMTAAFRPEYLVWFPENLEVVFPRGTLPSEENTYILGLDYQELESILQPWAVPRTGAEGNP